MKRGPVLITTPIYYVNDVPHIGHAYTTIAADALARFYRLTGREVYFLTGTDEHGKKIEEAAAGRAKKPKELADEVVARFKELWTRLDISNDDFIRTTDERHKKAVQHFWNRLGERGEIYLGDYEGLYCTGCEAYYTEKELEDGGKCPVHKRPVEKIKEASYFFKMGSHGKWLASYIRGHDEFIQPESRRNEILAFVDEGLKDLSISRTTFAWGIPVPGDEKHIVYVWIDALLNYMAAPGYPDGESYKKFWGEDGEVVHLIGKDILRFHTVYWPSMLHAAGLRMPDRIYAHGWWTVEGQKMSKSLKNVVDPNRLIDAYGVDEVRYFLLREVPFGDDGNFSHEALAGRVIGELANTVGNLANRILPLVKKNFPEPGGLRNAEKRPIEEFARDFEGPHLAFSAYAREMDRLSFSVAIEEILDLARSVNDFVQRSEPWKLGKDPAKRAELAWVFERALGALDVICVALYPFLPTRMQRLWEQLGRKGALADLRVDPVEGPQLEVPDQVGEAAPIFARKEDIEKIRDGFLKEVGVATAEGEGASEQAAGHVGIEQFMDVQLKVGRIAAAYAVPKSKKLIRLEVDLGEESGLRQIVAGIAEHFAPDDLIGRKVVVVANLKPAKLMGIESQGMLLAAQGEDGHLSLIDPGERAKVGVRVK